MNVDNKKPLMSKLKKFKEFLANQMLLEQSNLVGPYSSYVIRTSELKNHFLNNKEVDLKKYLDSIKNNEALVDDVININDKLYKLLNSKDARQSATDVEYFTASIFNGVVEQGDGSADTIFYDFVFDNEYVSVKSSATAVNFQKLILRHSPLKLIQFLSFIYDRVANYHIKPAAMQKALTLVYNVFHGDKNNRNYKRIGKQYKYLKDFIDSNYKLRHYIVYNTVYYIYNNINKKDPFEGLENELDKLTINNYNNPALTISLLGVETLKNPLTITKTQPITVGECLYRTSDILLGVNKMKTSGNKKLFTIQQMDSMNHIFPEIDYQCKIKVFKPSDGYEETFKKIKDLEWELRKKVARRDTDPATLNNKIDNFIDEI